MPKLIVTDSSGSSEYELESLGRLDEVLLELGYLVERQCGGRGDCGRCRVVAEGNLSELAPEEKSLLGEKALAEGWRLACKAEILGDAAVTLPVGVPHTDKIFGQVLSDEELPENPGLAVDLGTTTVGALLVDMDNGGVLAARAVLNNQGSAGADVISRLQAARVDPRPLERMASDSVTEAVSGLFRNKPSARKIKKAVVVGNTAMHHLLLGLDIGGLAAAPFAPSGTGELIRRGVFNTISEDVDVLFPPLIGGFVGSDALACVLYFDLDEIKAGPAMAVDIGTNGEVILGVDGEVVAASTAAGPALEGVNISCGMRAAPGAVVDAHWRDDELVLETVGGLEPEGLAGSGLISVVRKLADTGVIDPGGRIVEPDEDPFGMVGKTGEGKLIRLAEDIVLTQNDVREFQKAKGAVRACADVLLDEAGIAPSDLKRVFLTGSFGGKLDVEDVLAIGLLPPVDIYVVRSIPNGAGLGAAMMLNEKQFARACELAAKCRHMELFNAPAFMDKYIDAMAVKY